MIPNCEVSMATQHVPQITTKTSFIKPLWVMLVSFLLTHSTTVVFSVGIVHGISSAMAQKPGTAAVPSENLVDPKVDPKKKKKTSFEDTDPDSEVVNSLDAFGNPIDIKPEDFLDASLESSEVGSSEVSLEDGIPEDAPNPEKCTELQTKLYDEVAQEWAEDNHHKLSLKLLMLLAGLKQKSTSFNPADLKEEEELKRLLGNIDKKEETTVGTDGVQITKKIDDKDKMDQVAADYRMKALDQAAKDLSGSNENDVISFIKHFIDNETKDKLPTITPDKFENLRNALNKTLEDEAVSALYKKIASADSSIHENEVGLTFSEKFHISVAEMDLLKGYFALDEDRELGRKPIGEPDLFAKTITQLKDYLKNTDKARPENIKKLFENLTRKIAGRYRANEGKVEFLGIDDDKNPANFGQKFKEDFQKRVRQKLETNEPLRKKIAGLCVISLDQVLDQTCKSHLDNYFTSILNIGETDNLNTVMEKVTKRLTTAHYNQIKTLDLEELDGTKDPDANKVGSDDDRRGSGARVTGPNALPIGNIPVTGGVREPQVIPMPMPPVPYMHMTIF
jgi:hypothetical protein